MDNTDIEHRLAALEQEQQRLRSEVARLDGAVEEARASARSPSFSFVVRLLIGLVGVMIVLDLLAAVVPTAGNWLYDSGGRGALWGALGCVVLLAAGVAVAGKVRNRNRR